MTIVIGPTKAAAIASAGESNNPILLWDNQIGTLTTSVGVEVESATLSGTGTTYDAWIATPAAGEVALQNVLASAQSLNCIAITSHNIGTIGASVRAQYSTNSGGAWIDSGAGIVNPDDDQAIMFYFDDVSTDYWRLIVTGAGVNDVEIAVAVWGNALTVPQRIYQGYTPPITRTMVDISPNVSEGANLLGVAYNERGSDMAAEITHVEPTFIRGADFKGFMTYFNRGGGAFWAWRPTKYDDLFYGWRSGAVIKPTNAGPNELMAFTIGARLYDNP